MLRREPDGTLYLRPGAIPLVVAAIVLPIVAAILIGVLTVGGIGPGLAVGAAAVAVLAVVAFRARPGGR
ncbi:MAG: hypothetical protein FJW90_07810, partial [Actinobacteria bacterium]|nr:hypothetical protein [Actinomycetota bacterium]